MHNLAQVILELYCLPGVLIREHNTEHQFSSDNTAVCISQLLTLFSCCAGVVFCKLCARKITKQSKIRGFIFLIIIPAIFSIKTALKCFIDQLVTARNNTHARIRAGRISTLSTPNCLVRYESLAGAQRTMGMSLICS